MDIKFKTKDGTIVNIDDNTFKFKGTNNTLTKIPISDISNAKIDVATLRVYTTAKKEYFFVLNKGDIKKLNPFLSNYKEAPTVKQNDTHTNGGVKSKKPLLIAFAIIGLLMFVILPSLGGASGGQYSAHNTNAAMLEVEQFELSSGSYTVGQQVPEGRYFIHPQNGQSGNLFIYDNKGDLIVNEVLGSEFGVQGVTVFIGKDYAIEISGINKTKFTPYIADPSFGYRLSLDAGYWIVGLDIPEGRFNINTSSSSGNLVIKGKNGTLKTNEVFGEFFGVTQVNVDLKKDDLINIMGMESVKFSYQK